mmetsp:Transcript_8625/g.16696  ORF Transcript_8625/g.16696 Transcript_8625/m.16696 type:complete len:548 (-) Transcript_8625:161-1804(-)
MMLKITNSVLFAVLTAGAATTSSALDYVASNTERIDTNASTTKAGMIVGGEQAEVGDYPYFVSVGYCGGALIAPDIVLTAAHCRDLKGEKLIIGAYKRNSLAEGAQERVCETWIKDPLFGTGGSDINYDFALCKLNRPVQVDQSSVKLEINEEDSIPTAGTDLLVMGLGSLASGSTGPEYLHDLTVPVISNEVCNSPTMYYGGITDIMLCAGFASGGKDSCQGDSGGPIVKRTYQGDGTFVDTHVGVVSWGQGCALANRPGVYARTSKRAEWIKDTMCTELGSIASFCNNNPGPSPSGACGGNTNIQFQLELNTDKYGADTSWSVGKYKDVSFDFLLPNVFSGDGYNSNTLYTLPSDNDFYCLEAGRCYRFDIVDSYMDGFMEGGYYKGYVDGKCVFAGDGQFDTKQHFFCAPSGVGTPTPSPSGKGTGETTLEDFTTTNEPEQTAPPTRTPTRTPTRNPTRSPTRSPTATPTADVTSDLSSSSTDGCTDDPNFRFKNSRKKTCAKWVARGNKKKIKKKCKKTWKKRKVYEYCPATCGSKANLGGCA